LWFHSADLSLALNSGTADRLGKPFSGQSIAWDGQLSLIARESLFPTHIRPFSAI
jgi:hypothetical protein